MNIKLLTMKNRIRKAWAVLTGPELERKCVGVSIEVKNCDKCERGICETCGYKVHSEGVSKLPDCNDCGKARSCEYKPRLGAYTRINCPLWEKEAVKQ